MANRHLARTLALQSLFEWDFYHGKADINTILQQVKQEFAPEFDDQGFSLNLLNSVLREQKGLDKMITEFAPEWPLDQITMVDRNVLRIGIYELKFDQSIPPKVAINEAIELAKTFGGSASGKFVNGVLGSIYKKMTDSGEKQDLASQGIKEESSGGFVFRHDGQQWLVALILDAYNKWTFSKGHIESGETAEQAASREVKEEFGISDLKMIDGLGELQLKVNHPNEEPFRKLVHLYLFTTKDTQLNIPKVPEFKDGKWFTITEAIETIGYEESKKFLEKAINMLNENNERH